VRSIDRRALASVLGGRGVSSSSEMDPQLIAALQGLVKAVASINDSRKAAQQQSSQQVMQFVMKMVQDKKK